MKKSAITRIVIYSLVIFLLVGLLAGGLALHAGARGIWNFIRNENGVQGAVEEELREEWEDALRNDDGSYYMEAEQGAPISVAAGEVTKIQILWVTGDLTLVPGDVEQIQIRETVTNHPLLYSVRDGRLKIKFSEDLGKGIHIGLNDHWESKDLTVTVPRDWTGKELEIQTADADVLVQDMTWEEIEFQGASGQCEFLNCQIGELSVETASGDVTVTGTLRELECQSASADCDVNVTNVPEEISLEAMSGDLKLVLPADAGFTAELQGLSTDFDTDFEVTRKNGKYISGDGSCRIEIQGMSGSAEIMKAK